MSAVKISCPMCGQPLDQGSVEEVFIEFSTLNICGRCGFGLDLRWRGRGSALSQPSPNIVIVSLDRSLPERLTELFSNTLLIESVSEPVDALGICAKALRRERPLTAIIITHRGESQRWSDVAVAVRALEEGFKVPHPTPLWFFSSVTPNEIEQHIFEDLADIYWRPCQEGAESNAVLEIAPQLFQ